MSNRKWITQTIFDWHNDDQVLQDNLQEFIAANNLKDLDSHSIYIIAKHLRDYFLDGVPEESGLYTDLIINSLKEADWYGLTKRLLNVYGWL